VFVAASGMKKLGSQSTWQGNFGFVQDWKLLGPFDNLQGKGFSTAYQPEVAVNLRAT